MIQPLVIQKEGYCQGAGRILLTEGGGTLKKAFWAILKTKKGK